MPLREPTFEYVPLRLIKQANNLFHAPNVVSDLRRHRRGATKCLMNPAEVVMHEVKRNGGFVVGNLL